MDQPKKYRAWFEAEGKESLMVDTDNPTGIIDMFIGFDDTEVGRGIWLPNLWDRMIIEKKQKSTYQSPTLTMKEREVEEIFHKYDDDADVLYINFFNPPLEADDSFTVGDLIIRLLNGKPIGITLLYFRANRSLATPEVIIDG